MASSPDVTGSMPPRRSPGTSAAAAARYTPARNAWISPKPILLSGPRGKTRSSAQATPKRSTSRVSPPSSAPRQRNRVPRLETRAAPSKHSRWMDRQGDLPRPRIARNGYPLHRGNRYPRYRGVSAPIQGRLRPEDTRCGLHQRLGEGVATGRRRASSQGLRARKQPHAIENPARQNPPLDQMAGRASRT